MDWFLWYEETVLYYKIVNSALSSVAFIFETVPKVVVSTSHATGFKSTAITRREPPTGYGYSPYTDCVLPYTQSVPSRQIPSQSQQNDAGLCSSVILLTLNRSLPAGYLENAGSVFGGVLRRVHPYDEKIQSVFSKEMAGISNPTCRRAYTTFRRIGIFSSFINF